MKIFVLVSRIPFPLEKGDKLRAYNQVKLLAQQHEVHLCCLNFGKIHPEATAHLEKICQSYSIIQLSRLLLPWSFLWALFNYKPYQVAYFYQLPALKKITAALQSFQPDHVYCQLVRTTQYLGTYNIKKTLDYQDSFSAGIERRELRSSWFTRWFWASEKRRLVQYEKLVFEQFDYKTIISFQDKESIQHPKKNEIVIVPNGVDLQKFIPLHCPQTTDLLFTGNMSYPPNVESVVFLVNKVLPLIRKEYPSIKLTICGANPTRAIRNLASSNVVVTGWVPDIVAVYHSTKIFIAPMQMGAGLQNKLLEAMACGLPCVTSQLAANALLDNYTGSLLIGNEPQEYAAHVLQLLQDREFREEVAQKGRLFVLENYSWTQAIRPLLDILEN